jgi:hypothetical protein
VSKLGTGETTPTSGVLTWCYQSASSPIDVSGDDMRTHSMHESAGPARVRAFRNAVGNTVCCIGTYKSEKKCFRVPRLSAV